MRGTGAAVALMLATQTVLPYTVATPPASAPPGTADIAVTVEASRSRVRVGEYVTLTVTAANNGASPAVGVTVAIAHPTSLAVESSAAAVGGYDGDGSAWIVDSLAIGHTATLT